MSCGHVVLLCNQPSVALVSYPTLINTSSRSALFFDGYLPESKTEERKARLLSASKNHTIYFASHSTGIPSSRPGLGQGIVLFPETPNGESDDRIPTPAFTVPAVIDALKWSKHYSSLVKVVPGEADSFCASHARLHGGVVLTADSDLLVHDLGVRGSVAFFPDIELKLNQKRALVAAEYVPTRICERLFIPSDLGIPALAFELSLSPPPSFDQALERSKTGVSLNAFPEKYDEFMAQYLSPEVAKSKSHNLPKLDLDTRVSEIVLKAIVLSSSLPPPTANSDLDSEIGIEKVPMYLPFLFDSPSRTSAWGTSRSVRQLAYGFLQLFLGRLLDKVVEFTRLQAHSSGSRVDVPPPPSLDSSCLELVDSISRIREFSTRPATQWVVLSVYQDIVTSVAGGKKLPLSIQMFQQEANGSLEVTSWEFVHFLAQVQGTLYSLRMLRQIMDTAFNHHQSDKEWPASYTELRSYLSDISPLDEFPQLQTFAPLLQQVTRPKVLKSFTAAFQLPDDIAEKINRILHPGKAKRLPEPKKPSPTRKGSLSNNPFDVLGTD